MKFSSSGRFFLPPSVGRFLLSRAEVLLLRRDGIPVDAHLDRDGLVGAAAGMRPSKWAWIDKPKVGDSLAETRQTAIPKANNPRIARSGVAHEPTGILW